MDEKIFTMLKIGIQNAVKKEYRHEHFDEKIDRSIKKIGVTGEQVEIFVLAFTDLVRLISDPASTFKQSKVLTGFAGVGKTYIMAQLIKALRMFTNFGNCVDIMSFTGKAVNNLKKKGISNAETMHSVLYTVETDEDGNLIGFTFKGSMPEVKVHLYDEYSMVSLEHMDDLKKDDKPVFFFGDYFQIPPVNDDRNIIFKKTNYLMTEIRRNSGPIVEMATRLRNNKGLPNKKFFYKKDGSFFGLTFKDDKKEWWGKLLKFDKIITGTNKTKDKINYEVRKRLGYKSIYPVPGDKLMCIENIRDNKTGTMLVANGEDLIVETCNDAGIIGNQPVLEIKFTSGLILKNIAKDLFDPDRKHLVKTGFSKSKGDEGALEKEAKGLSLFDYGYACTCHKMQGSEEDYVLVLGFDMHWARNEYIHMIYTAITRAKKGVVLIMQNDSKFIFDKLYYKKEEFELLNPDLNKKLKLAIRDEAA